MTEIEHPATTLAAAINRVQVLLRGLIAFYEQPRDSFDLPPNFMMMSLGVAETCATQAQESLNNILQHCDLSLLPALVVPQSELADEKAEPESGQTVLASIQNLQDLEPLEEDASAEAVQEMAEPESIFNTTPLVEAPIASEIPRSGPSEQFARTYLELLQKLTAAEIFATEQQALSPNQAQQQPLLPLLRSLRQDIQKLHNVA